ncbi:MAG: amidohydrolase family protein [Eubacteriales bacterium]|nr:amidohydrolase family protein [Eubacteriales bacterium]
MRTYFKNAILYDGTGAAPITGDLLVEDDRILEVGAIDCPQADETIDCTGLALAPGFIDAHSHNDWFTARKNAGSFFHSFLEQGITTQVTGNCGFSPFGYDKDTSHKALIGSGLFAQGDAEGELSTLGGWMDASGTPYVNIIPMLGHMSSRISLAGYENRPLSEDELKKQDALLRRELDAGAAGISFGLMYEPDRYAPYEELKRAAKIAKEYGRIVTVHERACSAASTSYNPPVGGRAHNLRALDEMLKLTRETGVDVQYSHLIFVGESSWKTADEALRLIREINDEGYSFFYDSYAMLYGASVITVVLPEWYLSLPKEKRSSPLTFARLTVEIGVTKKLLGFNFNDIQITWAGEAHRDIIGKTVSQIAKEWKVSDLRAYLKLVDDTNGQGRVLMYKYLTDDLLKRLMADEHCLYMTDAWIDESGMNNPAAFCCFPEFLRIGRERNNMARVIRQMTGATADRFKVKERGYLKENGYADLVLFDPKNVAAGEDLNGQPVGIKRVYVNGKLAVENGVGMDVRGGRFLLVESK